MKIEQKEAVFSPVTITLETQEEVDQMYSLVYWNSIVDEDGAIDFVIEKYLSDKVTDKGYNLYCPDNQRTGRGAWWKLRLGNVPRNCLQRVLRLEERRV